MYPRSDPVARTVVAAPLTADQELLRDFLASYLFAYIKFFDPELPDEHPDNYYMEREWRALGPVAFSIADIRRILIPARVRVAAPERSSRIRRASYVRRLARRLSNLPLQLSRPGFGPGLKPLA